MQYTSPDYYDEFSCLAGKCPATCCAGWQIEIDEESQEKYIRYQEGGEIFGNRLLNGIDWKERVFRQDQEKRCEFLNEDNLCDIYLEADKDMLCLTCRTYPRHIEEFEGLREMSLCLSCPEAARIVLENQQIVHFLNSEDETVDEFYDEFNYLLFSALAEARDYLLEILQNRKLSIYDRMADTFYYIDQFQEYIDTGRLYLAGELKGDFQKTDRAAIREKFRDKVINRDYMRQVWRPYLEKLEILEAGWPDRLNQACQALYESPGQDYRDMIGKFEAGYNNWQIECEQLMVYWLYTYFCGAVYNSNAWGKAQLAFAGTMMIRELAAAQYSRQEKTFGKEDIINLCICHSREVEHSQENLDILEQYQFPDLF